MKNCYFYIMALFITCVISQFQNHSKGLLIVPGIGTEYRLAILRKNIEYLSQFDVYRDQWDCVVYVYEQFQIFKNILKSLGCTSVSVPGQRVVHSLKTITPNYLQTKKYDLVFILLDDVQLCTYTKAKTKLRIHRDYSKYRCSFNFTNILRIMYHNQLTLVSPRVYNIHRDHVYRDMVTYPNSVPGTAGCLTNFIEMFAYILTVPAYNFLWDLFDPVNNPYGWGYDMWYSEYARSRYPLHKMGVINVYAVTHGDINKKQIRADAADQSVKLLALKKQEEYYTNTLGIPLMNYNQLINNTNRGYVQELRNELAHCTRVIYNVS